MRIVREPLFQFLCIALILFSVNRCIRGPEPGTISQHITISTGQVQQISEQYRLLSGRRPSEPELRALVDDFIDEEVAYREAIARGLDVDDTIVRRRMRQKLEFLTLNTENTAQPSKEELSDWFMAHAENYHIPERISFRHVLASQDKRGGNTHSDAVLFLQVLKTGAKPDALGDSSMLPATLSLSTQGELEKLFGKEFAETAFTVPNGWFGPIQSAYGYHLIFITDRKPARRPALDDIRQRVEVDWVAAKKQEDRHDYLERLRQNYTVRVEWPNQHSSSTPE